MLARRMIAGIALMVPVWGWAAGPQAATETPFVTVVFRNWTAWDTNHDGRLSPEEIDSVVLDRSVSGDDAAAAGTLKLLAARKQMQGIALTKEYFQEYSRRRLRDSTFPTEEAAEALTVDILNQERSTADRGANSMPDWDLHFSAGRKRIALAAGGWTGRFDLDHVRQGPISDCFFLSSLGSLLVARPEQVKSLIVPLPDGTFQARFPGRASFIVKHPTDAELAMGSVGAGDGYWLPVIELAYSQYRMLKKGVDEEAEAADVIGHGGRTGPTIDALTGNSHKSIKLADSVEQRRAQSARILPELRAELSAAVREHRVMTVSVARREVDDEGKIVAGTDRGTAPHIPAGITRRHAYAIVSYDPSNDVIELWNPHGQDFTPKGRSGLDNGYPTKHGRFLVSLAEAYTFCTNFTFEMPRSTRSKSKR